MNRLQVGVRPWIRVQTQFAENNRLVKVQLGSDFFFSVKQEIFSRPSLFDWGFTCNCIC